ncbi:MAG: arginase family protein, partial [Dehalococcoidales bacterium]|nr:arginase family protein [Dehalococcoidales bacterium]
MAKMEFLSDVEKQYRDPEKSKVVIVPVPYDKTSTWGKGADKGPAAILEASATLENYDIESDSEPYKVGIFTDKPVKENRTPEQMAAAVEKRIHGHLAKGRFPIVLGGEHSVSIGAILAAAKKYKKLTVLQLDAHADLRQEYHGSKCNHACVMARARESCRIVQVGIRSMDGDEKRFLDRTRTFFAEEIQGQTDWMNT